MEQLYAVRPHVQPAIDNVTGLLLLLSPPELAEFAKQFVEADPDQASRLIDALIKALEVDK